MLQSPSRSDEIAASPEFTAIASTAPFRDLPEPVVQALADAASIRSYAAGEAVFAIGQYDGSEFLIVRSGRIKAAQADAKSGAMLFEDMLEGEIFGLPIAVSDVDSAALARISLTAERDSVVVAVDAAALREAAAQRPSLVRCLMLHFAERLTGESRRAEQEGAPERRVYAALSGYIERDAVTAEWRIPRMPKHRELADRADVEEADAANAVAKLIQSGVARRDYPGLVIDDIAQLNRLAR